MIAIKMRFLAGRFHATPWGHHVNEGVVEYPPSLWRLLRSLVATFYRTNSDFDEASLTRILDALSSAPEFVLPPASVGHTRHYDQANSSVKFFDTFVALSPDAELIWLWRTADLTPEDRENLKKLLRVLGTFGRSESWCEAELIENESEEMKINSFPVGSGDFLAGTETLRLLLPDESGEKLLNALKIETSVMRGKQKQLEPTGSRWVTYSRESNLLVPRRLSPRKQMKEKLITVARFALSSTVLPLVTDAMILAELTRFAISRNRAGTSFSPAFAGKTERTREPLKNHVHAHFLATDEDGDGRLDHLTVYAECGFNREDVAALGQIRKIRRAARNLPDVNLVLIGLGAKENFGEIPVFRKAKIWRSVTPFAAPRFTTRGAGKPPRPRDLPEAQLKRELQNRGFKDAPVRVTPTGGFFEGFSPIDNISERAPRFRWLEFHHERLRKEAQNKKLGGFEIEFAEETQGAISLGWGCHFGLGLFLPVTESNQ